MGAKPTLRMADAYQYFSLANSTQCEQQTERHVMKTKQIVRAWKDQEYRRNLSQAEQAELPAHPAGMIELMDSELGVVSGGATTASCNTSPANCPTHAPVLCTYVKNCPQ